MPTTAKRRFLYILEAYEQTNASTNTGTIIRFVHSLGWDVALLTTRAPVNEGLSEFATGIPLIKVEDRRQISRYLWRMRTSYDVLFTYNGKRYNMLLPVLKIFFRKDYFVKTDRVIGLSFDSPRSWLRSTLVTICPLGVASAVLFESPGVAQRFGKLGRKQNTFILPNCISFSDYDRSLKRIANRPFGPADAPYILYIGRLIHAKGADVLIRAFATLAHRYPAWRLEIVGPAREKAYADQLTSLVKELGLTDRVSFRGEFYGDDLLEWYYHSSIFCLPSRSEGMSNVIAEAMFYQKPIVCTDVGEARFQLEDGNAGLLVPPDDPAALANGLEAVMSNPALAERLGQAARRRLADAFDVDKVYGDFRRFLEKRGLAPVGDRV